MPRSHIDDEYAHAQERDPKILISTSRDPSSRLVQFAKELKLVFPNAQRVNRGGQVRRRRPCARAPGVCRALRWAAADAGGWPQPSGAWRADWQPVQAVRRLAAHPCGLATHGEEQRRFQLSAKAGRHEGDSENNSRGRLRRLCGRAPRAARVEGSGRRYDSRVLRVQGAAQVLPDLVEACRAQDFTDLVMVHEHRGEPDGLVVSHMPYGPTAYFGIFNTVRARAPGLGRWAEKARRHLQRGGCQGAGPGFWA